jgi:hypothetical protein
LKKSSALRDIPGIVTSHSGIVTSDSGNTPEIGHDQTESAVTFRRNRRSRSSGMGGHDGPEYALAAFSRWRSWMQRTLIGISR